MTKEALTQLREVHAIQGRDGCWDIDDYMLGLYNGLELALSIVENRACKYKQRPKSQPEQEPVAWEQFYPDIGRPQIALNTEVVGYVAPQRTWVGLTEEERDYFTYIDAKDKARFRKYADYIEAKLKDKNNA